MTDFVSFETLKRPNKPNHYLIAPGSLCEGTSPDEEAPHFPMAPEALFDKMLHVITDMPGTYEIRHNKDQMALGFVAKTKVLRFKDDVDIRILPSGEGATLAIYSRSRVGYSDMGVNKKRVAKLLECLHHALSAPH